MPTKWKFKIESENSILQKLSSSITSDISEETVCDIYFTTSNNRTCKIRKYSNNKARTISFCINDEGEIINPSTEDYQTFEEAFSSLPEPKLEKIRINKEILTFKINEVKICIHKFSNKMTFITLDGSDEEVLPLLDQLNLNESKVIYKSFDEIITV